MSNYKDYFSGKKRRSKTKNPKTTIAHSSRNYSSSNSTNLRSNTNNISLSMKGNKNKAYSVTSRVKSQPNIFHDVPETYVIRIPIQTYFIFPFNKDAREFDFSSFHPKKSRNKIYNDDIENLKDDLRKMGKLYKMEENPELGTYLILIFLGILLGCGFTFWIKYSNMEKSDKFLLYLLSWMLSIILVVSLMSCVYNKGNKRKVIRLEKIKEIVKNWNKEEVFIENEVFFELGQNAEYIKVHLDYKRDEKEMKDFLEKQEIERSKKSQFELVEKENSVEVSEGSLQPDDLGDDSRAVLKPEDINFEDEIKNELEMKKSKITRNMLNDSMNELRESGVQLISPKYKPFKFKLSDSEESEKKIREFNRYSFGPNGKSKRKLEEEKEKEDLSLHNVSYINPVNNQLQSSFESDLKTIKDQLSSNHKKSQNSENSFIFKSNIIRIEEEYHPEEIVEISIPSIPSEGYTMKNPIDLDQPENILREDCSCGSYSEEEKIEEGIDTPRLNYNGDYVNTPAFEDLKGSDRSRKSRFSVGRRFVEDDAF